MSKVLEFESNSGATLTFSNREYLEKFAVVQSERVASLLHVLAEANGTVDDGFVSFSLEIVRDLAYEVQLAVEALAEKDTALTT